MEEKLDEIDLTDFIYDKQGDIWFSSVDATDWIEIYGGLE